MLLGPNMVRLVNKAEQLGLEVARAPDPAGLQHRGTGAIDLQFLNLTDLLDRPELKLDKTIVRETVRGRSEEHTSELQSLMRISYAVFCLKKKTNMTSSNRLYMS